MTRALKIISAGPGVTVQDLGRPGYLAQGLSRGGAADRIAIYEGAALLGQSPTFAALEMAGMGGEFEATEEMRIALTGAPMRASCDGERLVWNATHTLPKGARLSIGATEQGTYGYLHVGGGLDTETFLGSKSTHLSARLGRPLASGETLNVGEDTQTDSGWTLNTDNRFSGGKVRIVPSLQTDMFATDDIARFQATAFQRDARGNRMGVRLTQDGHGFQSRAGLSVLSEVIVPGDIQVTGDGSPFVLLSECQTTGGYPRIGSVLPSDLPRVAQARPGTNLSFHFVTLEEAVEIESRHQNHLKGLKSARRPLIRDPHQMADLLAYELIGGVTSGNDDDE